MIGRVRGLLRCAAEREHVWRAVSFGSPHGFRLYCDRCRTFTSTTAVEHALEDGVIEHTVHVGIDGLELVTYCRWLPAKEQLAADALEPL